MDPWSYELVAPLERALLAELNSARMYHNHCPIDHMPVSFTDIDPTEAGAIVQPSA